jgi:hypothetical protein
MKCKMNIVTNQKGISDTVFWYTYAIWHRNTFAFFPINFKDWLKTKKKSNAYIDYKASLVIYLFS